MGSTLVWRGRLALLLLSHAMSVAGEDQAGVFKHKVFLPTRHPALAVLHLAEPWPDEISEKKLS